MRKEMKDDKEERVLERKNQMKGKRKKLVK